MDLIPDLIRWSRRDFFDSGARGIGLLALAALLRDDGLLAAEATAGPTAHALDAKPPHFAPKAKNCICIYLEGAPSHIDLFDPKPALNRMHLRPMPESFTKNVRFAFIKKESALLVGSPRQFRPQGQCGTELCDLLPHLGTCMDEIALVRSMHTETFNHHPGQMMMNSGVPVFGRPTMGAWINYGLGSAAKSLPGYVVLNAGGGTSGGTSNWSSGFLPTTYQGTLFRNQGEPILNLQNPPGLSEAMQGQTIAALAHLNELRQQHTGDLEIQSRIAAYEMAFRMQSAAPELVDLSGETQETLDLYGIARKENRKGGRGYRPGVFRAFATNCLLARRLVERGVRFINLFHASWDHHSNLDYELAFNCEMADQPVAALLKDLKRRGLLDSTLVLWLSEFGRTPLGENNQGKDDNTGRDHHPFAFSIWMAGGGVKGGQVVGKTDELGWGVVEDPVHVNDLHATILHLFGLDHLKLTYRFQGRDFRLTDVGGQVVKKLLA